MVNDFIRSDILKVWIGKIDGNGLRTKNYFQIIGIFRIIYSSLRSQLIYMRQVKNYIVSNTPFSRIQTKPFAVHVMN